MPCQQEGIRWQTRINWTPYTALVTLITPNNEVIPVINVGKPKGQSRMDNPEKPATLGIQDDAKYSTICVAHHYTQTNTNNVSMIWALMQTARRTETSFVCGNCNEYHKTELRT